MEEKLKIEIEKINHEFNISKYTIDEFFIKPKRSDIKTVQGEIDALQSLQDGLEEKLKIEIEKINDEFNISKYTIEEFFIKPKRTDIYDIKIELLWQEQ